MAITITWATRVINIPQSDLTLVSGSLYELDLDTFRLQLKDLEDGEEGIAFPDTHSHTPPFTFGTTTLARVVNIINGYTITFEDVGSPYAVRLAGANSNIDEVTNINNVSVRSLNTAGLVTVNVPSNDALTIAAIEAAVTDLATNGVDLKSINKSVLAAVLLALAANTMARGTISVVNSPTSVEVQFDDGFDPEAGDGIAGRAILYTSGSNVKGGARISAVDGQGAGDPLITLVYAGTLQPAPSPGDTLLLV